MKQKQLIQFILILVLLLVAPLLSIIYLNDNIFDIVPSFLSTVGLSLFVLSIFLILKYINILLAKFLVVVAFILFFLTRITLSLVYDFSGRGFTSEFFAHFSWKSFIIGLDEYIFLLVLVVVLLGLLIRFLLNLLSVAKPVNIFGISIILIAAITLMALFKASTPEWRLLVAYQLYHSESIELLNKKAAREEALVVLKPLRGDKLLSIEKNKVSIQQAQKPKNIIIIYLESFSDILTNNTKYPNLTPNLDQLKKDYISFENNFASGYVTIEGLANSQCGTMMNMENGNNSLTSPSGRMLNLPCLADVLHEADYNQIYYGGADSEFAGKGAFFSDHGYDEVHGLNDWDKKGLLSENIWGLSDAKLFNQAFKKIVELNKKDKPFNLTLLTLGTHIPGFIYEGCSVYDGVKPTDKFLDAIHCTDYLVGQFIEQLKNNNILDNTVVYIQGDHPIFPNHTMRKLFGKKARDQRVYNVIISPDLKKGDVISSHTTYTMNLAPNVLDLLNIEHNVDFILANSDFSKDPNKEDYLLSRYFDYFKTNSIINFGNHNIDKNKGCNADDVMTLPLSNCEKKRAVKAIYRIGATYNQSVENQNVCSLGVDISVIEESKMLNIVWGSYSLNDQFYSLGREIKNTKQGFYLLSLNSKDQVISNKFFGFTKKELSRLKAVISKDSFRYVLLSNLSTQKLNDMALKILPDDFAENKFLYSQNKQGKVHSLMPQKSLKSGISFSPLTCDNGA